MHVCVLTRTHTLSKRSEDRDIGSVPLETCTHRSLFNFHRNCFRLQFARTSPSTFLFLPSSQCQRADLTALAGQDVIGEPVSTFLRETRSYLRLPGRSSALSEAVDQWERLALVVVNVAGCRRDVSVRQHPISLFAVRRNPKLPKPEISF